MGIPIGAGRGFDDRDRAGTAPVAVVNEQFARRMFKGSRALGRHIRVFRDDPAIEIVGIAKDVRERGWSAGYRSRCTCPVAQANMSGINASHTYFPMNWVVRTSNSGAGTIRAIRDEMRASIRRSPSRRSARWTTSRWRRSEPNDFR